MRIWLAGGACEEEENSICKGKKKTINFLFVFTGFDSIRTQQPTQNQRKKQTKGKGEYDAGCENE